MMSNVLEMPSRKPENDASRESFIRRFERQAIDSFEIPMSLEIRLIYQCLHRSLSPFNLEMETEWKYPLQDQENRPYARFRLLIPEGRKLLVSVDVKRIPHGDYRRALMTRPHHCPLFDMLKDFSVSLCHYGLEGVTFTQNFVLEWVRNAGFLYRCRQLPDRIETWGIYSLASRAMEFHLTLHCPD